MRKILLLTFCLSIIMVSCSKEEITETSEESISSNTSSKTEVVINVIDIHNNPKSGYVVMMFVQKPSSTTTLPTIIKQVNSNSEGIAKFDLDSYLTTPKTLYFEAFTKDGNNYIWKSISHPSKTISKGTKWTTSIIVN